MCLGFWCTVERSSENLNQNRNDTKVCPRLLRNVKCHVTLRSEIGQVRKHSDIQKLRA